VKVSGILVRKVLMSVEVLTKIRGQYARANGNAPPRLDFVTPRLTRLLRKAHLLRGVNVGLPQTSWGMF